MIKKDFLSSNRKQFRFRENFIGVSQISTPTETYSCSQSRQSARLSLQSSRAVARKQTLLPPPLGSKGGGHTCLRERGRRALGNSPFGTGLTPASNLSSCSIINFHGKPTIFFFKFFSSGFKSVMLTGAKNVRLRIQQVTPIFSSVPLYAT